ncbi:hypothetical protein ACFL0T_06255 [Candidatus Omnitrophota bacterium]
MDINVTVINPERVVFQGKAKNIILPGEEGIFEILPYHKSIISRLISGRLIIEDKVFRIHRGIAKADKNHVTIIVEDT